MLEDEDINIFKDKVESLIVQDHKYTLDKVDNIIESLNKQLLRKDIIIVI